MITTLQLTLQESRKAKNLTFEELSKITSISSERLREIEEQYSIDICLDEYELLCAVFELPSFEVILGLLEKPEQKLPIFVLLELAAA